ncbi:hypothetical protein [Pseudomonas petrae]|uniref:Uncharacterized protein n=1 Tax=Pseudomonas petrae TaxID=2912190 RepID=A0ABS9I2E3_9PSED|nr:hypothetical protein [Pseudomonas petrae]MCF7531172.1 hypothetical protein [Pseudomonas petrae]MCF7540010.1 hypothetical protein [Pseudomonas petrae]MCF7541977.1 hypothetical protein [Pseudomonas petrae]MCF7554528.1 hypothetical protein [Pseudomonas petrae]
MNNNRTKKMEKDNDLDARKEISYIQAYAPMAAWFESSMTGRQRDNKGQGM